jgi:hypothetical protein
MNTKTNVLREMTNLTPGTFNAGKSSFLLLRLARSEYYSRHSLLQWSRCYARSLQINSRWRSDASPGWRRKSHSRSRTSHSHVIHDVSFLFDFPTDYLLNFVGFCLLTGAATHLILVPMVSDEEKGLPQLCLSLWIKLCAMAIPFELSYAVAALFKMAELLVSQCLLVKHR